MSGRKGGGRRAAAPARRFPRVARVNEVLRQVLAEEIERLVDTDERLAMVTVTAVESDPDFRRARVLLSSLDADAADALADARIRLQATVARQVRLKWTPTLSFVVDPAVVDGLRVEEILRRLHARDDGTGTADGTATDGAADGTATDGATPTES